MAQFAVPPSATTVELDAAFLQAAVALGLAAYAAFLHRRYRKPHFAWFAVAWGLYLLRLLAIIAFLASGASVWLYWHQVVTGWTALALLWSALVFSRRLRFQPAFGTALLFPVAWSYLAIYVLRDFLWAALPAVLFLSVVTCWTAAVFWWHWRRTGVGGARLLAATLCLWAVHHLDYPFLRARGAWAPWGYYLDIVFLLGTAAGLTLLVLDELRQGVGVLTALAGPAPQDSPSRTLHALLGRALTLPATRGAALCSWEGEAVQVLGTTGACDGWGREGLPPAAAQLVREAAGSARVRVLGGTLGAVRRGLGFAFAAALPIPRATGPGGALVLVGDVRNPFTALDDDFLVAFGRQVGAALDTEDLTRRLRARTADLSRLSTRMIEQHEEERRRLSLELHDETAQVFSAVKLQLGLLRERAAGDVADGLARATALVDEGMRSIRTVTETLRPAALDDLGLVPALRSLAASFEARCGIPVLLEAPERLALRGADAELALFRALQEALANVARHAHATRVWVSLRADAGSVALVVQDDGVGTPTTPDPATLEQAGHLGLAGMRERIGAVGGHVTFGRAPAGGVELRVVLPLAAEATP